MTAFVVFPQLVKNVHWTAFNGYKQTSDVVANNIKSQGLGQIIKK